MYFHQIGPLGRFDLVVAMSIYLSVPFPCEFFQGLSLALRSHDQIPASHWSTLLPYHMVESDMVLALACNQTGSSIGHASILLHAWSLKNLGWVQS